MRCKVEAPKIYRLEEASNTNKKLELQNGKLQNELQEAQAEAKRRG